MATRKKTVLMQIQPDKFLNRDSLWITVFIFLIYWLLHVLYVNVHFLDHDHQTREDSDVNDIVYSAFGKAELAQKQNQDIYLVNIGNTNREQIAQMIDNLAQRQPKVIGLDITFSSEKDTLNRYLQTSLKQHEQKLVLGGYFTYKHESELGDFIQSDTAYRHQIPVGFTNFVTTFSQGTVRRFTPFVDFKSKEMPSFGAAVAEKATHNQYILLKKRHHSSEIINYKYALSNFLILNKEEVLSNTFQLDLKNKIVLVGFIGETKEQHSLEDYHFTPLNQNGNLPDMPGLAIHANIINMILTGDYINPFPIWLTYLLSFLLCFLHVRWFLWSFVKKHIWFHLHFKIIQFISLAILVFVSILIYSAFNLRIETSIIAVPIALSVDVLYFSEAIARRLHEKYKTPFYFLGTPHH